MDITKVRHNRSGVIFVTVLVIIIVMMVVTVSIISMNVSQVSVTERDVRRIQAEIKAQGMVDYLAAQQLVNASPSQSASLGTSSDDYLSTGNITTNNLTAGYSSNVVDINVNY